jgi:hypothetical protein
VVSRLPPPTCRPFQTRFRFGFAAERLNLAGDGKSPDHYAKGTRSGLSCDMALSPLVGVWFQVHLPPLIGVLPIFRSRYWFAIGRQGVLSLGRWSSRIQTYFHVLGPTQVPHRPLPLSPTGLSPSRVHHSRCFGSGIWSLCTVLQPHSGIRMVWAIPLSLAATYGVEVSFLSSGY